MCKHREYAKERKPGKSFTTRGAGPAVKCGEPGGGGINRKAKPNTAPPPGSQKREGKQKLLPAGHPGGPGERPLAFLLTGYIHSSHKPQNQ